MTKWLCHIVYLHIIYITSYIHNFKIWATLVIYVSILYIYFLISKRMKIRWMEVKLKFTTSQLQFVRHKTPHQTAVNSLQSHTLHHLEEHVPRELSTICAKRHTYLIKCIKVTYTYFRSLDGDTVCNDAKVIFQTPFSRYSINNNS